MVGPHRGIIPRTVEDIFTYIVNDPEPSSKYLVRASYLQIYNEVISDLLRPERSNLAIREDKRRGVFVDGLSEWVVRSPGEVYTLMQRGQSLVRAGVTGCMFHIALCTGLRLYNVVPGTMRMATSH